MAVERSRQAVRQVRREYAIKEPVRVVFLTIIDGLVDARKYTARQNHDRGQDAVRSFVNQWISGTKRSEVGLDVRTPATHRRGGKGLWMMPNSAVI